MYVYWGCVLENILLMGCAVEFQALGSQEGNEFQGEAWFLKWWGHCVWKKRRDWAANTPSTQLTDHSSRGHPKGRRSKSSVFPGPPLQEGLSLSCPLWSLHFSPVPGKVFVPRWHKDRAWQDELVDLSWSRRKNSGQQLQFHLSLSYCYPSSPSSNFLSSLLPNWVMLKGLTHINVMNIFRRVRESGGFGPLTYVSWKPRVEMQWLELPSNSDGRYQGLSLVVIVGYQISPHSQGHCLPVGPPGSSGQGTKLIRGQWPAEP